MIKEPKKINLPDMISKLYLKLCTEEGAFINKRLNGKYFAIRKHLEKDKQVVLNNLLIYLQSFEGKNIMTLTDLYQRAEEYRKEQLLERDREINRSIVSENKINYTIDKFIML